MHQFLENSAFQILLTWSATTVILTEFLMGAPISAAGRLDAETKLDWNPERTFVFVVGGLASNY
jgi:hypothetical protein